jgi:2-methylisocitrate lyase-like PEP mutase family enzyme
MEEAVHRLKLASEMGADVCFIEGVKSKELLESTVAALAPKPVSHQSTFILLFFWKFYTLQVLVNVISGGLTPSFTTKEAEKMGAKIISQCLTCFPDCPSY